MDREQILERIANGLHTDDDHIRWCVDLVANEPDDLIRAFARSWLSLNCIELARRVVFKS